MNITTGVVEAALESIPSSFVFNKMLVINKMAAMTAITLLNTIFTLIPLFSSGFTHHEKIMKWFSSSAAGLMCGLSVLEMINCNSEQQHLFQNNLLLERLSGACFIFSFVFTFFANFYFANLQSMKSKELIEKSRSTTQNNQTLYEQLQQRSIRQLEVRIPSTTSSSSVEMNEQLLSFEERYRQTLSLTETNISDIIDITPPSHPSPHSHTTNENSSKSSLVIWIVAVSVESFFSCIVLASQSRPRVIWIIFSSVISGDWAECIIIGQKIHNHFKYQSIFKQVAIVILLQFINIIGFIIGMMVDLLTPFIQLIISTLLFASLNGVFLHISMVDMIMKDFYIDVNLTRKRFYLRILLVTLGILSSIMINVFFMNSSE